MIDAVQDKGNEPRKPHLSPTQLEMYCKCPESYRRRYIEKEIIPPGIALIQGKGVDGAATLNFSQKIASHQDLPISEIVDAAAAAFDEQLRGEYALSDEEVARGAKRVLGEAKDETVSLAELHAREQAPEYQPVSVQREARIILPNSTHDLLGYIDLEDDRHIVTDIKTANKRKNQEEADNSVQLTLYAASHRIETGRDPAEVRLDVLVKNKTPVRQVVSSHRGRADYQALVNRVKAVLQGIKSGNFSPATPGAWWCGAKWCGYYSTCPYVNHERVTVVQLSPSKPIEVKQEPVAKPARTRKAKQPKTNSESVT